MSEKARKMLDAFVALDDEKAQHDVLLMAMGAAMAMSGPKSDGDQKGDAAGGSSGVEQRGSE